MRKQHFAWTFLVTSLVLSGYGLFSVIYSTTHGETVPVLGIIFLSVGAVLLVVYLSLLVVDIVMKRKAGKKEVTVASEEERIEEVKETPKEPVKKESSEVKPSPRPVRKDYEYVRNRSEYDTDYGTIYVKRVGYGPILRVEGNRILDMRTNTYYRIQDRQVFQEGSGPVYEIYGDKIKRAFGGYLYEISGSNINKVFGGFFASVSGNYLTKYDLSEKYEIIGTLNKKQLLAITALIFGEY